MTVKSERNLNEKFISVSDLMQSFEELQGDLKTDSHLYNSYSSLKLFHVLSKGVPDFDRTTFNSDKVYVVESGKT